MDLRRRPFAPLAARALADAVAQGARLWNLHFGDELSAPNGFVERVRQPVAVAVKTVEALGRCIQRLEQGEGHTAIAMLIHELVVITGAVPAAHGVNVL